MEKKCTIYFDYSPSDKIYFDQISNSLLTLDPNLNIRAHQEFNDKAQLSNWLFGVDLVIVLFSKNYLETDITYNQEERSYLNKNSIKVVPIRIDLFPLKNSPIAAFNFLPRKGKALAGADRSSNLFKEVITDLLKIVEVIQLPLVSSAIKEERIKRSKKLDLQESGLTHIPIDLLTMPWLESLNLEDNKIERLENLENLKNLVLLKLSRNKISRIENISSLSRLQYLLLNGNLITTVENLSSFKQLSRLNLADNRIKEYPNYLNLDRLEYLSLSHNVLTKLPRMRLFPSLKGLYLAGNDIKELTDIRFSSKLAKIDLSRNKIESIRPLLRYIEEGRDIHAGNEVVEDWYGINITQNPNLKEPAVEVIEAGREAVIKYFRDAEAFGTTNINIVKLILIGNSRSGKTNFSQFIRTGKVDSNTQSTHLLDISMWQPGPQSPINPLKVNIFDFGGQDYYHDAHRMFYSHDTAYVLLWDKESNCYGTKDLDANEYGYDDFPLEYWLESVNYNLLSRSNAEMLDDEETKLMLKQIPILVLQNKIDLLSYSEVHRDEMNGIFLDQARLSASYPNIWGFSSVALAKNRRHNSLTEIFTEFIQNLPSVGRLLISYQVDIITYFLNHRQAFEILDIDGFLKLCLSRIKSDKVKFTIDDARNMANIMNNMGLILYDENEDVEHIYTNVPELNKVIGKIMKKAKESSQNGVFWFKNLANIEHKDSIIKLLSRNNSVIDLGKETYLAPQFLPRKPAYYTQIMAKAFSLTQVRFVFKAYFHKSLLLKIFAKYVLKYGDRNVAVDQQPYWRDGIIITRGEGEASQMVMLEFVRTEKHGIINIRTSHGFDKSGLEGEVARDIEELSKGWSFEKELSLDGEHFIAVTKLKRNLKNNQFFCHIAKHTYNISAFKNLEDFEKLPKKLFISYSSKNIAFARRLMTHLEVLKNAHLIEPWFDRMIDSGAKWDNEIKKEMALSDVVIFLLSPDFLATKYIMEVEVPQAIELTDKDQAKLFFIELQQCGWLDTILAQYQQTDDSGADPKTPIAIKDPLNDEQWFAVLKELRVILEI